MLDGRLHKRGAGQIRIHITPFSLNTHNPRFTSFICAGGPFGTVIAMPVSSYLCESRGWQSVFYVFGSLGCIWFLVWAVLIYDGPELHPRISERERTFIKASLRECEAEAPKSIPWCSILTSTPVWAIAASHVTQNFGFYVLLTELPTYLKNVLGWDLGSKVVNGNVVGRTLD